MSRPCQTGPFFTGALSPSAPPIPPEAPPDHQEIDLDSPPHPRFDPPKPLELETRGVTSHPKQQELWHRNTAHKNSVAAKLRESGHPDIAQELEFCHSTFTVAVCSDCGRQRQFPNRCDLFYCPECAPRLARERAESVEWWSARIHQPKHVVLTVRNMLELTKGHIQEFKRWFSKLRRSKFANNWLGGFYRLEITNEGRGWHLHLHALINAKWIDAPELARQWAKHTNGLGHIVKVKDCRSKDYLAEVTKYVVKGSQLAKWSGDDIHTFIQACSGVRTFGVFGQLYGQRTEFAEWIAAIKDAKPLCECGSCNVRYYSEPDWLALELDTSRPASPRPPPQPNPQHELNIQDPHCWTPHRRD
jgi:hypothetical protein